MQLIAIPTKSHLGVALDAFRALKWRIAKLPVGARLNRNGQRIRLQWLNEERLFRIFVYKVTQRGEVHRAAERRIEITSTYKTNLTREPEYTDVVLGYDRAADVLVGIDSQRMEHGGPTGNASTHVAPDGIDGASDQSILVLPHKSDVLGSEYQAYFRPLRLTEYIVNIKSIHLGTYDGRGDFSGNSGRRGRSRIQRVPAVGDELVLIGALSQVKAPIWCEKKVWRAFETGNAGKPRLPKVSLIDFLELHKRQIEIGLRGEMHVLKLERKRLLRARLFDLAEKVEWVSRDRPYDGYDILSFEANGTPRFIEVKASTGELRQFSISANEWSLARKRGCLYVIYRVTSVDTSPAVKLFRDPVKLSKMESLRLTTATWSIEYD